MKTLLNKQIVLFSLFLFALFISVAYAETLSEITFPIKELGNCGSKEECKTYCDAEKNVSACRAFARKNNLEEGDKVQEVKGDGGPGGCATSSKNPIESCEKYCDDTAHMKECVAYAKTHDLMDSKELAEAGKVLAALDRGAKLPSGCTNQRTCESVCEAPSDMKVARECFDFAEEAGLLPSDVDREQAEKVFKAIEEGRAPFKSPKDFEQCENPPSDEIMEKCINFALENGFLSGEEAEMVKKTGGKGPGGCRGRECEKFCENPDNSEACYNFAKEYGLMDAEMEKGSQDFLNSLKNAPPAVKTCVQAEFGDNLDKIFPGPKTGAKLRDCYEQYGRPDGEMQRPEGEGFPEDVRSCILSQIGEEGFKELTEKGPTSELDEKMRPCFEKQGGEDRGMMPPRESSGPEEEFRGSPDGEYGEYQKYPEGAEGQMPPEDYQTPPSEYPRPEGDYQAPIGEQPPESYSAPAEVSPAPTETEKETAPTPAPATDDAPQSLIERESMLANISSILEFIFK